MKRKIALITAVLLLLTAFCAQAVFAEQNVYSYLRTQFVQGYMPTGKQGKTMKIELPLIETQNVAIDNVQYTVDLGGGDSPFELGNFAKSVKADAEHKYNIVISPKIRANAADCYYTIVFNFAYDVTEDGETKSGVQAIPVSVKIGDPDKPVPPEPPYTEPPPIDDGRVYQPRLIVKSYDVPQTVEVGETFALSVVLENMSKEAAAQNVRVSVKSEDNNFLPPPNGVSSQFFDSIGKKGTKTIDFELVAGEDITSKTNSIGLEVEYEDSLGTPLTLSDSYTISVKQRMRPDFGDGPRFPDSVEAGENFSIIITVNNKGKGSINNISAALESDGITTDGQAFAGNLEPGGSRDLELNCSVGSSEYGGGNGFNNGLTDDGFMGIMPREAPISEIAPAEGRIPDGLAVASVKSVILVTPEPDVIWNDIVTDDTGNRSDNTDTDGAGSIDFAPETSDDAGFFEQSGSEDGAAETIAEGTLVITYEDDSAQEYRQEYPISITVRPASDTGSYMPPETPEEAETVGFPIWAWVAIGGGVLVAALVVIGVLRAKKRKAMFEEDELY